MYDKNPAFAINLTNDCELIVRLRVTEEIGSDGMTAITDPDKF